MTSIENAPNYEVVKKEIEESIEFVNERKYEGLLNHHSIEEKENKFVIHFEGLGALIVEYVDKYDLYHVFQAKSEFHGRSSAIDEVSRTIQMSLNDDHNILAESWAEFRLRK